ncbi:MAG: hypothetical protein ABUK11_05980 [Mariprofundaceae bacterium]
MADILSELIKYTETHFVEEEQFMRANQYSGYTFHKSEHDEFIKKSVIFSMTSWLEESVLI